MKISAPKGTRDILPPETATWQHAERVFAEVCALYGYGEIRIPTFEATELFQRGVGDTTDIVQKEMYTFDDKGGRSMTLRPEGTAGVVRCYIENGMASLPAPVRLFYNITAFRYENVQKGRYREFHQLGAEAFGAVGPDIDAEMIAMLGQFLDRMEIGDTALHINSIGCPDCRAPYQELLKDYLRPRLGELCALCRDRFDRNPLRILDCKEAGCRAVTADAPRLAQHLCPDCAAHFDRLRELLTAQGIGFITDPDIVRGLDYYTRTVFEFISENVGTQGTVCAGGRYDGLVESIGGPATPGIGFALGLERLLMERAARGLELHGAPPMDLYLAAMGDAARAEAARIAARLRREGLRVETDLCGRSLKAQMKYANKRGVRHVVVLGDQELESGVVRIRRMSDGTEHEAAVPDLLDRPDTVLGTDEDRTERIESDT